jgi:hypothetical protein
MARLSRFQLRRLQMVIEELREYIRQWIEDYSHVRQAESAGTPTAVAPADDANGGRKRSSSTTSKRSNHNHTQSSEDSEFKQKLKEKRKREYLSAIKETKRNDEPEKQPARSATPHARTKSTMSVMTNEHQMLDDVPRKLYHFAPLLERIVPQGFLELDETRLSLSEVRSLIDDLVRFGPAIHPMVHEVISREVAKGTFPMNGDHVAPGKDADHSPEDPALVKRLIAQAKRKLVIPLCAACFVSSTESFLDHSLASSTTAKLLPISAAQARSPTRCSSAIGTHRTIFLSSSLAAPPWGRPSSSMSTRSYGTISRKVSPLPPMVRLDNLPPESPSARPSKTEVQQMKSMAATSPSYSAQGNLSKSPFKKPVSRPASANYKLVKEQYKAWTVEERKSSRMRVVPARNNVSS